MQIKYEIKPSQFGKGLFTTQHITSGACVWKYTPNVNVIEYNETQCKTHLDSLQSKSEAKDFLDLTYGRFDKLCFITDDGRYINHSETPNCKTKMETGHTYAIKDIYIGEELFEDYTSFDHPFYLYHLLEKYQCAPDYYTLP